MVAHSLKSSLSVAFGYVPMGMAFGILLQNLGLDWWWATLMGLVIFAGSAQFLAVGLLAARVPLPEVFLATFFLNLRHLFYGLTLLDRYRSLGGKKPYAIFGLTDETFSLVSTAPHQGPRDSSFIFWLTLFNQLWWVLGCTLGALVRSSIAFDSTGLEFSLTCLFLVLLLDRWKVQKQPLVLALSLAVGLGVLALFQGQNFLLISLAGLLVLALVLPVQEPSHD